MTTYTRTLQCTMLAATLLVSSGCNNFLSVDNPNVIDVHAIDPVKDAATLANSAQQNYAAALGWMIMYSSWFNGESIVAETFPTRNEFGRRDVSESNGSLSADVWGTLSLAAASTKILLDLNLPNPTTNLNYGRSYLWRGYSFVQMAESFCSGTVSNGPELTTAQMLDSAVANFTKAITVGNTEGSTTGKQLANTALVGRARAQLQAGRKTEAAADAATVPAGFAFTFTYVDDAANRNRLANRMWQFTLDRGSIGVSEAFRVSDPRVPYKAPGQHTLSPQDASTGEFYIQNKFPTFASPIRVASKLEADYIAAEAAGNAAQLAMIIARRAANEQPSYNGPTDDASVLSEFLWQKSLDFFLEGQRMGDFRRNPTAMRAVPVPGAPYFKPGFPTIGNENCYPLPLTEIDNNPNFKK